MPPHVTLAVDSHLVPGGTGVDLCVADAVVVRSLI